MARVYLGMPCYGPLTAGAARGFFRASLQHQVERRIQQGSLLALNHNALWCWALNDPPDYFAMQHADIEPEDGWLDVMIAELEARELDVLGAVAPIKDTRGLTSIAVGTPDLDPWEVQRRLTLHEVFALPETFTSRDVGGPLLINTGLWVCRFDVWAQRIYFTVRDRIVQREGVWLPEVEPEDWSASRMFHRLGLRVAATRKVRLTHAGQLHFANHEPWGQAQDDKE